MDIKRHEHLIKSRLLPALFVIVTTAGVGTALLTLGNAATFSTPAEAESGRLDGNARSVADPLASAESAVIFGTSSQPDQFFAPTSYHNAKLTSNAALDPNSTTVVADLTRQAREAGGGTINADKWTTSVYTVGANQATRKVTMPGADSMLQSAMNAVPLPDNAQADSEADAHLTIWQPSSDTLWEFWGFTYQNGAPTSSYGGRMQHVSSNPGHFIDDGNSQSSYWGATATSIPLVAGLIRINEAKANNIPHAIALAIPQQDCNVRLPAIRTDVPCYGGGKVPAGARFRLPANLNIEGLGLPPLVKAIAYAVQNYGFVVRDHAGSMAMYAERPTDGSKPYDNMNADFSKFPWDKLQMLPPTNN